MQDTTVNEFLAGLLLGLLLGVLTVASIFLYFFRGAA